MVCSGFVSAEDLAEFADPARVTWALLRPGELCVTPPADAHKPACTAGESRRLKKACVKVRV